MDPYKKTKLISKPTSDTFQPDLQLLTQNFFHKYRDCPTKKFRELVQNCLHHIPKYPNITVYMEYVWSTFETHYYQIIYSKKDIQDELRAHFIVAYAVTTELEKLLQIEKFSSMNEDEVNGIAEQLIKKSVEKLQIFEDEGDTVLREVICIYIADCIDSFSSKLKKIRFQNENWKIFKSKIIESYKKSLDFATENRLLSTTEIKNIHNKFWNKYRLLIQKFQTNFSDIPLKGNLEKLENELQLILHKRIVQNAELLWFANEVLQKIYRKLKDAYYELAIKSNEFNTTFEDYQRIAYTKIFEQIPTEVRQILTPFITNNLLIDWYNEVTKDFQISESDQKKSTVDHEDEKPFLIISLFSNLYVATCKDVTLEGESIISWNEQEIFIGKKCLQKKYEVHEIHEILRNEYINQKEPCHEKIYFIIGLFLKEIKKQYELKFGKEIHHLILCIHHFYSNKVRNLLLCSAKASGFSIVEFISLETIVVLGKLSGVSSNSFVVTELCNYNALCYKYKFNCQDNTLSMKEICQFYRRQTETINVIHYFGKNYSKEGQSSSEEILYGMKKYEGIKSKHPPNLRVGEITESSCTATYSYYTRWGFFENNSSIEIPGNQSYYLTDGEKNAFTKTICVSEKPNYIKIQIGKFDHEINCKSIDFVKGRKYNYYTLELSLTRDGIFYVRTICGGEKFNYNLIGQLDDEKISKISKKIIEKQQSNQKFTEFSQLNLIFSEKLQKLHDILETKKISELVVEFVIESITKWEEVIQHNPSVETLEQGISEMDLVINM